MLWVEFGEQGGTIAQAVADNCTCCVCSGENPSESQIDHTEHAIIRYSIAHQRIVDYTIEPGFKVSTLSVKQIVTTREIYARIGEADEFEAGQHFLANRLKRMR